MTLDARLLAVLACPKDKGPLFYLGDDRGLINPRLGLRYQVRDGIPVMLVDEADVLSAEELAQIVTAIDVEGIPPTFVD